MSQRIYTSELSKGQGAIDETLALLQIWQPGMSSQALSERVVQQGVFGASSQTRAKDLCTRVFAKRYLINEARPALLLKACLENKVDSIVMNQLMLIFTFRQHPVLQDFVTDLFWPAYEVGQIDFKREEIEAFLRSAVTKGRILKDWTDGMYLRVSRYLMGALSDFAYLEMDRTSARKLQSVRLSEQCVACIAWEQKKKGLADTLLPSMTEWSWFGKSPQEIRRMLSHMATFGLFLYQDAGDLIRITWNCTTDEEFFHGLARLEI